MSPTLAKLERKIMEVLRCGEEATGKEESEFRGQERGRGHGWGRSLSIYFFIFDF